MDLFSVLPRTFNTPGWLSPLVNSQTKKSLWLAVGLGVATWAWRCVHASSFCEGSPNPDLLLLETPDCRDYRAWIAYGTGPSPSRPLKMSMSNRLSERRRLFSRRIPTQRLRVDFHDSRPVHPLCPSPGRTEPCSAEYEGSEGRGRGEKVVG